MDFTNHTNLAARFFTGAIAESHNGAWVVARCAFRQDSAGHWVRDEDWPIFEEPLSTAYGTFPSDIEPHWTKTEVLVVGKVSFAAPLREGLLTLNVGAEPRHLIATGPRHWVRTNEQWTPSEPELFQEMPLTFEMAYGGKASLAGTNVIHPLNPTGIGLVTEESQLTSTPLPRLEDPVARYQEWNQPPLPAGWGPRPGAEEWEITKWFARHQAEGRKPDRAEALRYVSTLDSTCALPGNRFPVVKPGTPISLTAGIQHIAFTMPDWKMSLGVMNGAETIQRPLRCSGIWILLDTQKIILTWKARCAYQIRAGEERSASLVEGN